ncbi:MAG: helix-turn-helix transcriptional regulator [Candidatus Thorarchaeota archaeon]|jgi:DNA-binding transcriptional ArsR family regulator
MQQRHALIILLAVFMLMPFVFTTGESYALQSDDIVFDPVSITAHLNANRTTRVEFRALAINQGLNPVSSILIRIDSVQVYLDSTLVDNSPMPATLNIQERYSTVSIQLDNPLAADQSVWIHLTLSMNDLQSEAGLSPDGDAALSDFIFYVRPLSTYSNFTLTVILPKETLLSQQSVTPLFPQASSNYTDGLSMAFEWYIDFLQSGQEKAFIVRYQEFLDSSTNIGLDGSELIVVGAGFLGIGLVFGYFGPKLISKLREIGRVRIVGITSEEEEVMDAIRVKGGSCPQKDLYRELDMSQAKVSLILTALEERGLVRRFKDGRENTVHIIEE